jgi:hypothetical protein
MIGEVDPGALAATSSSSRKSRSKSVAKVALKALKQAARQSIAQGSGRGSAGGVALFHSQTTLLRNVLQALQTRKAQHAASTTQLALRLGSGVVDGSGMGIGGKNVGGAPVAAFAVGANRIDRRTARGALRGDLSCMTAVARARCHVAHGWAESDGSGAESDDSDWANILDDEESQLFDNMGEAFGPFGRQPNGLDEEDSLPSGGGSFDSGSYIPHPDEEDDSDIPEDDPEFSDEDLPMDPSDSDFSQEPGEDGEDYEAMEIYDDDDGDIEEGEEEDDNEDYAPADYTQ